MPALIPRKQPALQDWDDSDGSESVHDEDDEEDDSDDDRDNSGDGSTDGDECACDEDDEEVASAGGDAAAAMVRACIHGKAAGGCLHDCSCKVRLPSG